MTARRRRRGNALVGTMIFLVLSMLLWTAVYQQAASQLRVEKALTARAEHADRLKRATAWALTLLETDKPPVGASRRYSCRMILDGQTYLVTYLQSWMDPDIYWVQIVLKDPAYTDYPLAPNHF